jgi:hypothetical protein
VSAGLPACFKVAIKAVITYCISTSNNTASATLVHAFAIVMTAYGIKRNPPVSGTLLLARQGINYCLLDTIHNY